MRFVSRNAREPTALWHVIALRIASLLLFSLAVNAGVQHPSDLSVCLMGSVVEMGTGAPIAGAEVSAGRLETTAEGISRLATDDSGQRAVTDANGRFELSVPAAGTYLVRAAHSNYRPPGPELDAFTAAATVVVEPGSPRLEGLRIELSKDVAIIGRILDEHTREPLPGFAAHAGARSRRVSFDVDMPVRSEPSGRDGRFHLKGLPPAPYRVRIDPPRSQKPRIEPGTISMETAEASEGYCVTWWPGAANRAHGMIIPLSSGAEFDLGNIAPRRCMKYAVTVQVTAETCGSGARMNVALRPLSGAQGAQAEFPCGSPFTILQVAPGDYELIVSSRSESKAKRIWGYTTISVTAKHERVEIMLNPASRICGIVSGPDPMPEHLRFSELRITIRTHPNLSIPGKPPVRVNQRGEFCDEEVPPGPQRLRLTGLPNGIYASGLTYNGVRLESQWLPSPSVGENRLNIRLSDGAGQIDGRVLVGKIPQAGARVFLVRWPVQIQTLRQDLQFARADAEGRFTFERVTPGRYRLLAALEDVTADWTLDSLLARLNASPAVVVKEGESKNLDSVSLAH